jgi:hypothetical protein
MSNVSILKSFNRTFTKSSSSSEDTSGGGEEIKINSPYIVKKNNNINRNSKKSIRPSITIRPSEKTIKY